MRTTVTLDPDVAAALAQLRRRRSLGLSAALNELARAGLSNRPNPTRFRQRSAALGVRLDVSNVAEALEVLDQPELR
ncbi:MAG TPA: ribbon-helix-helix protein, CopG family [Candidatus Dormibacteraeota bacterium]|nr:ribbon-helix-helix protein, CopG family [Candidatus Dormibacteraeota bacterium]